jgi:hypothetical protein
MRKRQTRRRIRRVGNAALGATVLAVGLFLFAFLIAFGSAVVGVSGAEVGTRLVTASLISGTIGIVLGMIFVVSMVTTNLRVPALRRPAGPVPVEVPRVPVDDPAADPEWLRRNGMPHAAALIEYNLPPVVMHVPANASGVTCPLCGATGYGIDNLPAEHIADPDPSDDALFCPTTARRWRVIFEGKK